MATNTEIGRDLQVGTVWVNDWVIMRDEFEEGGYKQSRRGRLRVWLRWMTTSSTITWSSNPASSHQESLPPRTNLTKQPEQLGATASALDLEDDH